MTDTPITAASPTAPFSARLKRKLQQVRSRASMLLRTQMQQQTLRNRKKQARMKSETKNAPSTVCPSARQSCQCQMHSVVYAAHWKPVKTGMNGFSISSQ